MKNIFLSVTMLLSMNVMSGESVQPVELFPLNDVRLTSGIFQDGQNTDLEYILALDPEKLLAPYFREAGLPVTKESYGNWESSGLDGHIGGHYLSALALMYASTGDAEVLRRLNYYVSQWEICQENTDGYISGIPGSKELFDRVRENKLDTTGWTINGKWVPWYNLHKVFAGLRDAYLYADNQDAKGMLITLSDWAVTLTDKLSDDQMQDMLRAEHGGMNEVLADVADISGDEKYMDLAIRFSHQAILNPLKEDQDKLTGMHANTQIPKVIGFKRIGDLADEADWQHAAQYFWQTVRDHRTVAIGGNSTKEHFHDINDFSSMINEVEGPETCNTYNMLRLTELLYSSDPQVSYADYYERALFNHILSSQRPETGGFVYFTAMRPGHYRNYSQVDKGMWCCVGSGIESHAKYGKFIYAHDDDSLYVNLFISSTLKWREKGIEVTQTTVFPDEEKTLITINSNEEFTLKIRYPLWVDAGELEVRVNNKPVVISEQPGEYISLRRCWRKGDEVEVVLPMKTQLEQMPDQSNYYALLHGPIVLAAKTNPFADEKINYFADDSRMGHLADGQLCPLEATPLLVSDGKDFMGKIKPVPGKPLTFIAPDLVKGKNSDNVELIPFFRLHDSRYMIYWAYSAPGDLIKIQEATAEAEKEKLAVEARTIDKVSPGEQQPESDHFFADEGGDSGRYKGRHWRSSTDWFSYELTDENLQAKVLRLVFTKADAGRQFNIYINKQLIEEVTLGGEGDPDFYPIDFPIPEGVLKKLKGKLEVKFVAKPGSIAGSLYGLRLLK